MAKPLTQNTLFYGENLPILREHFPDECVDLIYLDPPFNSNGSYNVLFKDERGQDAAARGAESMPSVIQCPSRADEGEGTGC